MPKFVLPEHFLVKLLNLRSNFQEREQINLEEASQPYAISRFFGATDVHARKQQIYFIEKMLIALAKDLFPSPDNGFDRQKHLTALQVLVVVCFFIKSRINKNYLSSSSSSTLAQLINEAMSLDINPMDPATQACCLLATERFTASEHCFESLNSYLKKQISVHEWHEFTNFVSDECKLLNKEFTNNYPITSIMMPLVAKPCETAGYALGWVFGNWLGKSAALLSTHTAITVTLGSGLILLLGPSATLGALLITPTLAGQILETYCGISLAFIMGKSMNLVGNSVGFTVGMSLDLSMQLLWKICSVIANHFQDQSPYSKLTGIDLTDGIAVISGIPLEFGHVELSEKQKELQSIPVVVALDNNELLVRFAGTNKRIPLSSDICETLNDLKKLEMQKLPCELTRKTETETYSLG